uniref:Uncharacterized protein n=1 Tax=Leptocylindrus danicus TaxID=163516 RepID=A0A7S2L9Q9_9STRA
MAQSVGRVVAAIESSLLRWEHGQYSSESQDRHDVFVRSIPMFGKPRSLEIFELESDGSSTFAPIQDIRVDPATLCKGAWAVVQLAVENSELKSIRNEVVRIATKVFSLAEGKLIEYALPKDIVRISWAYIKSRSDGVRRASSSPMIRKIVQQLNENNLSLDDMAPNDVAWLLWCLGEAGVRTNECHHKKRYLTLDKMQLTLEELVSLSPSESVALLQGITSIEAMNDTQLLKRVIADIESKVPVFSPNELVSIVTSLSKLRSLLSATAVDLKVSNTKEEDTFNEEEALLSDVKKKAVDSDTSSLPSEEKDRLVDGTSKKEFERNDFMSRGPELTTEILMRCNGLIKNLASVLAHSASKMTPSQIRQTLHSYVFMAIQSDELFDVMDAEVNARIGAFDRSFDGEETVQSLLKSTEDRSVDAAAAISSLRDNLAGEVSEEILKQLQKASEQISGTAAAACKVSNRVHRVDRGASIDSEDILRSTEDGAMCEFGRCQELIASYRRIEFTNGNASARKSRYNKPEESRVNILSRINPFR